MSIRSNITLFIFSVLILPLIRVDQSQASDYEVSGYVGLEARTFLQNAIHPGQREQQGSVVAQPEFYKSWQEHSLTISSFFRLDSADAARSHVDLREFFVLWVPESFELGVGIRKVFWGVTESQHLVDIINQTDLVELPDGEEKLGQPMVNLSVLRDWGTLDLFLLPYFRERTFPGIKGRLRSSLVVETDQARFESGAENLHLDLAFRYSQTLGAWDVGLSHFSGTGREPTLVPKTDASGHAVLIPFYEQIGQTGLDVQGIMDVWLLKLEMIRRTGQGKSFTAWTTGFEYSFTAIFGSKSDLGIIGEWLYDTRKKRATTPFQNDLMMGLRLAINDMDDSQLLIGIIQDLDSASKMMTIEGNRRFGDHWKVEVEGSIFSKQSRNNLLFSQRNDDFFQISWAYYF